MSINRCPGLALMASDGFEETVKVLFLAIIMFDKGLEAL